MSNNLDWNFFYDSWLIDEVPDDLEISFEEHPNGWKINPSELTLFFGANPTYVFGEGKLYHETYFADQGFMIVPLYNGVPNFDFVKSFSYEIDTKTNLDFFGNVVSEQRVGRVNVTEVVKNIVKKFYSIGYIEDKEFFETGSASSELINADKKTIDSFLKVEYIPIFANGTEFNESIKPFWFSTLHFDSSNKINNEAINKEIDIDTYVEEYYSTKGLYENVLRMENCSIDITDNMYKALINPDTKGSGVVIFFKTTIGFREGTVIDYGISERNKSHYGFRLSVYREGIELIINNGSENSNIYFYSHNFNFLINNAVSIQIVWGNKIIFRVNDKVGIFKISNLHRVLLKEESDKAFLCKDSSTYHYTNAGDFEEFGIIPIPQSDEFLDKFHKLEPVIPNQVSGEVKSLPLLAGNKTYSQPSKVMMPVVFKDPHSTKREDIAKKIYLSNSNSDLVVVSPEKDLSIGFSSVNIPKGYNVKYAEGYPYKDLDDSLEYCAMIKKITSDTHIPMKIHIEFQIPRWWNKSMHLKLKLAMYPINKMIKYNYKKFKTGEWL